MPKETNVSLKEFIELVLSERDKRYEQRFQAQETASQLSVASTKEALTVALSAAEKSSMAAIQANTVLASKAEEFADQKLQTHNSIRPWVQSIFDIQAEKIVALEKRVSRFENREEGMSATTKIIVGAIGLIATLVSLYFALQ